MDSPSPIRLLHLSDLRLDLDPASDHRPVREALTAYLAIEVQGGIAPDLVVITGDLTDRAQPAELSALGEWLAGPLAAALWPGEPVDRTRDRFLLVPGNHDSESKVSRGVLSMRTDLLEQTSQQLIAEMLSDDEDRAALLKVQRAYLDFHRAWSGAPADAPLHWWRRLLTLHGQRLHIAGLNSAWMAGGNHDHGRLLLGHYQLTETVLDPEAEDADWRIALVHHPLDQLAAFDAAPAREAIHLHRDILLHGHAPEPGAARILPADATRACLEIAGGRLCLGAQGRNAYQWVELHPAAGRDPKRVRILHRCWIKQAWQLDRNAGARAPGDAESDHDAPPDSVTFDLGPSVHPRRPSTGPARPEVPTAYIDCLRRRHLKLDLLGKGMQEGRAIRLSQVYVPAVTAPDRPEAIEPDADQDSPREDEPRYLPLLARIDRESLYCPAAPGAGKSTFCRWALLQCIGTAQTTHPVPAPEGFAEPRPTAAPEGLRGRLPVLVPLRDLFKDADPRLPLGDWHRGQLEQAIMGWIARDGADGLDAELFRAHLAAGSLFLLLDGLDEVPVSQGPPQARSYPRGQLIDALADALPTWRQAGNRVLLTSRPYGLNGDELHRLGLPSAPLAPLPAELQTLFVVRWLHTIDRPRLAPELLGEMRSRDLGAITANPLLLTALCVLYQDRHRLPGDIAELYRRICNNVLHNRYLDHVEDLPRARARLAAIAHGMHTGEGLGEERTTPEAQATDTEIERLLRDYAGIQGRYEEGAVAPAVWREQLLTRSGLLLPAGERRAGFYHFSIQEYLAAEHIGGSRPDDAALEAVFRRRSTVAEWRPTLLFLFAAETFHNRINPSWGLELLTRLAADLERRAVSDNPVPAVFIAEALGLCLAKGLRPPEALTASMRQVCLDAIADEVAIPERQTLGLMLGHLGDPRLIDLRDPEAYCEVPVGDYVYGDDSRRVRIDVPFLLSRYPVTNSQYRAFIDAGGYRERSNWSDDGWAWLQDRGHIEPAAWHDRRLNAPNQPVVGVSFWEADACCRWSGGRLPTGQEWEAAARGPDGCMYPWCGAFENGICNSAEAGLDRTSAVGIFPRSHQAQTGLADLAGNCWEWCGSFYGQELRDASAPGVLRGGAFNDKAKFLRSSLRYWVTSMNGGNHIGFRCVLDPPHQP